MLFTDRKRPADSEPGSSNIPKRRRTIRNINDGTVCFVIFSLIIFTSLFYIICFKLIQATIISNILIFQLRSICGIYIILRLYYIGLLECGGGRGEMCG